MTRGDGETHRPKLHRENRVMAVAAVRGRGQAHDVANLDFGKHALERGCWDVARFIDDDMPIGGDGVVDTLFLDQPSLRRRERDGHA